MFICMVYIAPVGSKHESESLFQNLVVDIVKVQTLRGIVLLGRDFNARIKTLLNTINTSDLCELLQAPELIGIEEPGAVAKRQNRDASVGGWGHKFLDLCFDTRLLILNGWMPGHESKKFTYLAIGGHNTINYIIGSPTVWQVATHFGKLLHISK